MEAIIREHINTKHLSMSIAKIDDKWDWMKVSVYSIENSPYGWIKRNLIHSAFGLNNKDTGLTKTGSLLDIEMYIREAVYPIYTEFPQEEIKELLNGIKEKI
tara:strand:- start:424 stop:729 length:306 start_codon:yes stop_codon:yes gene_type:complete